MSIYIQTTAVTRLLFLLFIFIFCFSIWGLRYSRNNMSETNERDVAIHDNGDIDSWLEFVDFDNKTVQVLTIEDVKRDIKFEASDDFLRFLKNECSSCRILPVTFICGKNREKRNRECDLSEPYILYVATRKVKPILIQNNPKSNP